MSTTWLITGASRGLGREWAEAALERGDAVAVTARDAASLEDLVTGHGDRVVPLALDVRDRAACFAAVAEAHARLGSLDVVVNNAGYGHVGMVEELTEAEVREELDTNLLGTLWVTQAALPVLRAQGGGRLLQVTSEGGVRAFPTFGAYHASKWAVEGLSESLAQEVAQFGIRVTLVEPGPYATGFGSIGLRTSEPSDAYAAFREGLGDGGFELGDPRATRSAILRLVDAEDPPLRLFLGRSLPAVREQHLQRIATWEAWEDVAQAAFR